MKMLTRIIQANPPALLELSLCGLGTTSDQGQRLLSSLICSEIVTLKKLDLSKNPTWSTGSLSSYTEMLARLIAHQSDGLETINLSYNNILGGVAAVLISTMRLSVTIRTLSLIKLKAVNWDDQEAQRELAQLIAEAPKLHTCDISWGTGSQIMYIDRHRKIG